MRRFPGIFLKSFSKLLFDYIKYMYVQQRYVLKCA